MSTVQSEDPLSLKEAFDTALASYKSLKQHRQPRNSTEFQAQVSKTLAAFTKCQHWISSLDLFSSNETRDDLSTKNIKYLAIEYYLAKVSEEQQPVVERNDTSNNTTTTTTTPSASYRPFFDKQAESFRLQNIKKVAAYLTSFFKTLNNYNLLNPNNNNTQSSSETSAFPQRIIDQIAANKLSLENFGVSDPVRKRNEKVARFRRTRELETFLKKNASTDDEDDNNTTTTTNNNVDEDDVRNAEFTRLELLALEALESLEGISMEIELLSRHGQVSAKTPEEQRQLEMEAAMRDARIADQQSRGSASDRLFDKGYTERVEQRLTNKTEPLLTKSGKVNRPFTILSSQQPLNQRLEILKKVQGTGQHLPTMTVEEYLEEEVKRGGIIQGGGPKKKSDDDDSDGPSDEEDTFASYAKSDAKTIKDREWDEFVESTPKGSGNTINRG